MSERPKQAGEGEVRSAGQELPGAVCGVILAGGQNRRMEGRLKALLTWQGRTFLERQLEEMASWCHGRIIAAGGEARAARLRQELDAMEPKHAAGVRIVRDIRPGGGPLAGLEAALHEAGDAEFLWVIGCDMPLVSADAAAFMALRLEESGALAAAPRTAGRVHPLHAVYRKACLTAVRRQLDAEDGRMMRLLEGVQCLYVDEEDFRRQGIDTAFVRNVNDPADYDNLMRGKL